MILQGRPAPPPPYRRHRIPAQAERASLSRGEGDALLPTSRPMHRRTPSRPPIRRRSPRSSQLGFGLRVDMKECFKSVHRDDSAAQSSIVAPNSSSPLGPHLSCEATVSVLRLRLRTAAPLFLPRPLCLLAPPDHTKVSSKASSKARYNTTRTALDRASVLVHPASRGSRGQRRPGTKKTATVRRGKTRAITSQIAWQTWLRPTRQNRPHQLFTRG